MQIYSYTARRKSDGAEICKDTITDIGELGMDTMADTIRSALVRTHPMARDLTKDDIEISISFAK